MPCDERVERAMAALSQPREAFRSAVTEAVEQVRAFLALHAEEGERGEGAARAAAELGALGTRWIDVGRYAGLVEHARGLGLFVRPRVDRALELLSGVLRQGDGLFLVDVPPGGHPAQEVGRALERIGAVFGAAQAVELIRGGRFVAEIHDALLDGLPFERWNRAERQIAPPLVVEVDGADLRVGGLGDFLDGLQRVVLVVRGERLPPAPLVGLISPGVLVMQTGDPEGLARVARSAGPAVAALVAGDAACFVHDPLGGRSLRERLSVQHLPAAAPTEAIGRRSVFQMAEELGQLRALLETPAPAALDAPAAPGAPPADPAGQLAGWLLQQAAAG